MRALSVVLALLVALLPLGAAQGDGGQDPAPADDDPDHGDDGNQTSNSTSSTSRSSTSTGPKPPRDAPDCSADGETHDADSEECRDGYARFCREHPDADACKRPDANGNGTNSTPREDSPRWCSARGMTLQQQEACRRAIQEFRDGPSGPHWVTFQLDEQNLTLLDLRIADEATVARIALDAGDDSSNVSVERNGRQLLLGDNDTELSVHDDATGLLRFKGDDGSLTLVFPDGITVQAREQGFRIQYGGGRVGLLHAEDAVWLDNSTVVVSGFAAYHVPANERDGRDAEEQEAHDDAVEDAKERRHVGAEIRLSAPAPASAALGAEAANESVEVLAYDDVEVTVDQASLADPDAPIRIEVSAELDEGRTIVVTVDEELLASGDPDDLLLRYFDLYNQTDGSVLETEVVIVQADSLLDVLDPTDDGGSPEYWIVQDADGVQVLFSVPHWSAHALTISSVASVVKNPSVLVGLVAGVAISLALATLLFTPRRRDDDL